MLLNLMTEQLPKSLMPFLVNRGKEPGAFAALLQKLSRQSGDTSILPEPASGTKAASPQHFRSGFPENMEALSGEGESDTLERGSIALLNPEISRRLDAPALREVIQNTKTYLETQILEVTRPETMPKSLKGLLQLAAQHALPVETITLETVHPESLPAIMPERGMTETTLRQRQLIRPADRRGVDVKGSSGEKGVPTPAEPSGPKTKTAFLHTLLQSDRQKTPAKALSSSPTDTAIKELPTQPYPEKTPVAPDIRPVTITTADGKGAPSVSMPAAPADTKERSADSTAEKTQPADVLQRGAAREYTMPVPRAETKPPVHNVDRHTPGKRPDTATPSTPIHQPLSASATDNSKGEKALHTAAKTLHDTLPLSKQDASPAVPHINSADNETSPEQAKRYEPDRQASPATAAQTSKTSIETSAAVLRSTSGMKTEAASHITYGQGNGETAPSPEPIAFTDTAEKRRDQLPHASSTPTRHAKERGREDRTAPRLHAQKEESKPLQAATADRSAPAAPLSDSDSVSKEALTPQTDRTAIPESKAGPQQPEKLPIREAVETGKNDNTPPRFHPRKETTPFPMPSADRSAPAAPLSDDNTAPKKTYRPQMFKRTTPIETERTAAAPTIGQPAATEKSLQTQKRSRTPETQPLRTATSAPLLQENGVIATARTEAPLDQLLRGGGQETEAAVTSEERPAGPVASAPAASPSHSPAEVKLHEAKQMIQHLAAEMRAGAENYKPPYTRLKIRLNPAKLGAVDVTMVQRGDNLHITISSNTPAVAILAQNAPELRAQLAQNGLGGATMHFSSNADQHQQQRRHTVKTYEALEAPERLEELEQFEIILPHYV